MTLTINQQLELTDHIEKKLATLSLSTLSNHQAIQGANYETYTIQTNLIIRTNFVAIGTRLFELARVFCTTLPLFLW